MAATLPDADNPEFPRRPMIAVLVMVCLSVLLPAGIVAWSVVLATSGKTFGCPAAEEAHYTEGALKDGELWFVTELTTLDWPHTSRAERRLKRLDLATGIERETGFAVTAEACQLVWMNDRLYVYTGEAVYQAVGSSLQLLATAPPFSWTFFSNLFVDDGRLTLVLRSKAGEYRLTQLVDGHWIEGRAILLPGLNRVWTEDAQRGRASLLPLSSAQAPSPKKIINESFLHVIPQGSQMHVLYSQFNHFVAYRSGFEFRDDKEEECSALAPENFEHEVSGWEPIESAANSACSYRMACDREGPIFSSYFGAPACVRRLSDGRWVTLTPPPEHRRGRGVVMADPAQSTSYLIGPDVRMYDTTFQRLENNTIGPVCLTKAGIQLEYLGRWQTLAVGLVLVWLAHLAIVTAGPIWFGRRTSVNADRYYFGDQGVTLASHGRRALALGFDLFLALVAAGVLLMIIGVVWPTPSNADRSYALLSVELGLSEMLRSPFRTSFWRAIPLVAKQFLPDPNQNWHCVQVLSIAMGLWFFVRVVQEGRTGRTPGKWLLGIHTLHSTLRPCGIARSLLRNLFLALDFPLFATPLPAVISMILSPQHKRLGDRAAETIVVRSGTVREG